VIPLVIIRNSILTQYLAAFNCNDKELFNQVYLSVVYIVDLCACFFVINVEGKILALVIVTIRKQDHVLLFFASFCYCYRKQFS